jgi:hypothetical protein
VELWAKWTAHYRKLGLITEQDNLEYRDGIVDEEQFAQTKPRVLFVLKETNDAPLLDLRQHLREDLKGATWRRVAEWTTGILEGFPHLAEITDDRRKAGLRRIAAINLKKLAGKGSADMSVVSYHALRDRNLLRRQIEEINPDYIVGCGTFGILAWLLELNVVPEHTDKNPVHHSTLNAWVLPMLHPTRASKEGSYNDLKRLISETR